jgi:hypothetical protein
MLVVVGGGEWWCVFCCRGTPGITESLMDAGNYPRADYKGIAGETDCEQTTSMGPAYHLY